MTTTAATRGHALAATVAGAMPLFDRFLVGFDDANLVRQAPSLPNHAAWTLGHLGLTTTRVADRIAGHDAPQPLPDADFTPPGAGGDARRFVPDTVAFGSTPVPDPTRYPSWARCLEVYRNGHERLITTLRTATDAQLDRVMPWGSATTNGEAIAHRMVFHLGMHAGQITDLRRALNMGRILG